MTRDAATALDLDLNQHPPTTSSPAGIATLSPAPHKKKRPKAPPVVIRGIAIPIPLWERFQVIALAEDRSAASLIRELMRERVAKEVVDGQR